MGVGSDVDVLVVVSEDLRIDRDLYRAWDQSPVSWNDHPLEPHFVHLPGAGSRLTGFWAEVAVDGVVIYEKELIVSGRLVQFRRQIAAGRMRRRTSQGQSYWVGEA
jgi:hypothetical protein